MPTKSKNGAKKNGTARDKPEFRFVNYDLTVQDKEWLANADTLAEFPSELIDDLVMEGYKFSLRLDERNQCCVASLTDVRVGSPFENSCLTGRGATPTAARVSVFYRHLVLARGDWSFFAAAAAGEPEIYS